MFALQPAARLVWPAPSPRRAPGIGGLDFDRRMNRAPESLPPLADPARAEEARWLQQAAGGDREAFARLYDRLSRPLFGLALQILREETEAQDVLHDVFLTLWHKAADFDVARGHVFSWASTLTRNRAIDRLRLRRRRTDLLAEAAPGDLPGPADDVWASGDLATFKERADLVRAAIRDLPPEQRQTLELAFFSGLTQQEIAAHLAHPLGTVKARIRRGLLKLRETLAPLL